MKDLEQAIRERAYHAWNEAGRPDGEADLFWLGAQREILASSLGQLAETTSKAAKKPAKAKAPAAPRKRKAA
jgi:hypothetical protein